MIVLDLFAGPGGWDVAARDLGINPIGFEIDTAANQTRRAAGLLTDDRDVAAIDLAEFGRPVTGLLASPPCQAFSTAGKQKGKQDIPAIRRAAIQLCHGRDHRADYEWADARSPLVLEPLRWALGLQPEWTCWEQVPPVLPFWELCGKLLEQRGYHAWTGMLHAETFGVPQTRKRAFLIASRVGPVGPPAPTHSRYYPRDKARLDEGVEKWVSMAEALGWADPSVEYRSTTMPNSARRSLDSPAPTIAFGNDAASARWTIRTGNFTAVARDEDGGRGAAGSVPYERPVEDPSPTVTTVVSRWTLERPATTVNCDPRISPPGRHDPAVSGSQQKGAIRVTVDQAAVLQSFPADYPWQGTKTKQFEQVGNAVPPGLARPVIEAALAAGALAVAA